MPACFVAAALLSLQAIAQKQPLSLSSLESWPEIANEKLSPDGQLLMYTLRQKSKPDTLVIISVDGIGEKKLANVSNAAFGGGGRYLIFQQSGEKHLRISGLRSHEEWQLENVITFQLSGPGDVLLTVLDSLTAAGPVRMVLWNELDTRRRMSIATGGKSYGSFCFNGNQQLAFTEQTAAGATSLRYFRAGMDSAMVKMEESAPGLWPGYFLKPGRLSFDRSGERIFCNVSTKEEKTAPDPARADVSIWRVDDDFLPPQTANRNLYPRLHTAVVPVNSDTCVQLNGKGDLPLSIDEGTADYVIAKTDVDWFAAGPNPSFVPKHFLINTRTGQRTLLVAQRDIAYSISPEGRYATWFDAVARTYHALETATGKRTRPGADKKEIWGLLSQSGRLYPLSPYGMAGWLPGDKAVLCYDEFDVWQVDPSEKSPSINLTQGYGRKHQVMLRIWNSQASDHEAPLIDGKELILVGFDINTKETGFYRVNTKGGEPVVLSKGPYLSYAHAKFHLQFLQSAKIQKAEQAEVYILRPSKADAFPNIVVTRDFKNFKQLTNLHPEKKYNWLTASLLQWKTAKGKMMQGVLYKPEDFDPSKKYPVIFYFYEKLSHQLHHYLLPGLSNGTMNIPFFASNGYLVFTPDIEYRGGLPGESAREAVESGAGYLATMPWVDTAKMGLQGHSFGGYQVNYIISHSNRFAAAQESAGACDFISYYNGNYRENTAQFYFERGQGRIGATLWQKPELYIKNSPLFAAPRVQTPLLIMHNRDDGEVPFQQGLEWFNALRRLEKKVWMLQYEKEYHGINQYKNKLDFTKKQFEFFEHYLKGATRPGWMH